VDETLPLTLPSPLKGERVEKGWRGEAEPYPELGEGVAVPLTVKLL